MREKIYVRNAKPADIPVRWTKALRNARICIAMTAKNAVCIRKPLEAVLVCLNG